MDAIRSCKIPANDVRSLAWDGDDLVDWAAGARRYSLEEEPVRSGINYAYGFDAVAISPSGEYQVLYKRLGTKGLVLRHGELVREINRSYYFAEEYEYPVALLSLEDGRELIAHCPDEYCRLEIEDLATGTRLTSSQSRAPDDFFHSRLDVSPSGRYLSSAGWIWHPMDAVQVYDIEAALKDATHLDGGGLLPRLFADESSAAFLDDKQIAVVQYDEPASMVLRILDLESSAELATIPLSRKLGTIMAVGPEHLLSLYEHPKLLHLPSNQIVGSWPEIRSGIQVSSILYNETVIPPPIALDPSNRRCAIASGDHIHVLVF
jgi:hypothetical protein